MVAGRRLFCTLSGRSLIPAIRASALHTRPAAITQARTLSTTAVAAHHSRFREYYNDTLRDCMMALTYEHPERRDPSKPAVADQAEASTPEPVHDTPPNPKRKLVKKRPKRGPPPPSSPEAIYGVTDVIVHMRMKEAIENKYNLLSGLMAIQLITGKRGEVVYSKSDAAAWKLRKNMPIATKVTLTGDDMYAFLEKLVEVVLPRLKEWPGLSGGAGDGNGSIAFGFEPHTLGLFPDIEGVYDMIPRITGFDIIINTTAPRDPPARLLLSGFQLPFYKGNPNKRRSAPAGRPAKS
ncbi:ribosomal protein [Dimargaris xerosporica]|nr:ribosomal protein [Dimargaris xerosporica]